MKYYQNRFKGNLREFKDWIKGLMIVHNVPQYIKSCYGKSYNLNMNKCTEINK